MLELFPAQHRKGNVENIRGLLAHPVQKKAGAGFIVSKKGNMNTKKERLAHCRAAVSTYLMPRVVIIQYSIPSNIACHLYRQFHQTVKPDKKWHSYC